MPVPAGVGWQQPKKRSVWCPRNPPSRPQLTNVRALSLRIGISFSIVAQARARGGTEKHPWGRQLGCHVASLPAGPPVLQCLQRLTARLALARERHHGQARRAIPASRLSHARLRGRARAPCRVTLLEASNPKMRRNSELFIEIVRFIWDANPNYDVYREFSRRHFIRPARPNTRSL